MANKIDRNSAFVTGDLKTLIL